MKLAHLVPHPTTEATPARSVVAEVGRARTLERRWRGAGPSLELRFRLEGHIAALAVPARAPTAFADRLWEHTCFEAFVKPDASPAYWEFNFAPSGEWARCAFSSYREPAPRATDAPGPRAPRMRWSASPESLALDVSIELEEMQGQERAPLRIALAAVVEARDGSRSYWALRHPAPAPDFHHADGFAIALAPPGTLEPLLPE